MAIRILVIFLPYIIGLMWPDQPAFSIVWSLAGSIFIAVIAQTSWFRQSDEKVRVSHQLLRPVSMYHLMFVAYNVLGGGAFALNAAGYALGGKSPASALSDILLIAGCQRLMLLAHASVTIGMKLARLRYEKPKYVIPSIPPYSLIVISFITMGVGILVSANDTLGQLSQKIYALSAATISLDIVLCIRYRRYKNLVLTLLILGLNLFQQSVSGWKGNILWTVIMLGAMLYPLMPKLVVSAGSAFILFWALYFYPFGLALRPLLWYQGVAQDQAVEISIDRALNMSLDERLDIVWEMMVGRANDLNQFVKYIEYVPANRPYYGFEIVDNATIALVPRLIWPEKPDLEKISMQRVYEAGVVSRQSDVSAKSNYYQDAYLSGGEGAIILACLFFGMLTMLVSRACERLFGGYDVGTCIIYTSLLGTLVNQPPSFEYFLAAGAIAIVLMFILFALGRATSKLVWANQLSELPENQAQSFGDQTAKSRRRSGALGFASQLLRLRR
jgi:hypothetical protein